MLTASCNQLSIHSPGLKTMEPCRMGFSDQLETPSPIYISARGQISVHPHLKRPNLYHIMCKYSLAPLLSSALFVPNLSFKNMYASKIKATLHRPQTAPSPAAFCHFLCLSILTSAT